MTAPDSNGMVPLNKNVNAKGLTTSLSKPRPMKQDAIKLAIERLEHVYKVADDEFGMHVHEQDFGKQADMLEDLQKLIDDLRSMGDVVVVPRDQIKITMAGGNGQE